MANSANANDHALCDHYLPWAKIHHKPSNYQSDRWRSNVLITHLGKLRLDELTPLRLDQF